MRKVYFGAIIIMILGLFSFRASFALFESEAISQNNMFTAASIFPTTSPSVTPSTTISPTISPLNSDLYVSNGYTCSNGASDTNTIEGNVSITNTGTLSIQVTLTNALPNTDYQLWVNQDPGSCPLGSPTVPVFISTDSNGDGSNTLSSHPVTIGATKAWVSLVGGGDVLRSLAVNL